MPYDPFPETYRIADDWDSAVEAMSEDENRLYTMLIAGTRGIDTMQNFLTIRITDLVGEFGWPRERAVDTILSLSDIASRNPDDGYTDVSALIHILGWSHSEDGVDRVMITMPMLDVK